MTSTAIFAVVSYPDHVKVGHTVTVVTVIFAHLFPAGIFYKSVCTLRSLIPRQEHAKTMTKSNGITDNNKRMTVNELCSLTSLCNTYAKRFYHWSAFANRASRPMVEMFSYWSNFCESKD